MKYKAFMLVLLCSVIACSTCSAKTDDDILLRFNSAFQYAVSNDYIWIKKDNQIIQYSLTGELLDTFTQENIEHIAASQDKLYVQYSTPNGPLIKELNRLKIQREWTLPNEIDLKQMEIMENQIVILATEYGLPDSQSDHHHDSHQTFYSLNMLTGLVEPLKIQGREDSSFVSYSINEKVIYAIDGTTYELVIANLSDGSVLSSTEILPFEYIYFDKNTDSIFGLLTDSFGGCITQIDPLTGGFHIVTRLDSENIYAGLRGNNTNLFVEDFTNGGLLAFSIGEAVLPSEHERLYIINSVESPNSPRMAKALELLQKDYPNIQVSFKDIADTQTLSKAMISGDPPIDIVAIQEYGGICSKSMALDGIVCDLSSYTPISKYMDDWINLDGIFTLNGKRYGLPQDVIPYFWQVNEPLFRDLGLSIPEENWTWEDFFDLCDKLEQLNRELGTQYFVLADSSWPYIMNQFYINRIDLIEKTASYDTDEFHNLMRSWKQAFDSGLLYLAPENYYVGELFDTSLLKISLGQYVNLSENRFVLPPKLQGSSLYPAKTVTLVVSSNSKNADIAAKFLSHYVSPEVVALYDPLYQGRFLRDMVYYVNANTNVGLATISEENNIYWFDLLENSAQEFVYSSGFLAKANDLFSQYMEGIISLDQFASTMQQITEVALRE